MHCFCTLLIPIPCSCTPESPQNPATPIPIPICPSPSPHPHPIPISPHPHPHPRLQAALRRHLVAAGSACTPASPVPPPAPPVPLLGWDAALLAPLQGWLCASLPQKPAAPGCAPPAPLPALISSSFLGKSLGKERVRISSSFSSELPSCRCSPVPSCSSGRAEAPCRRVFWSLFQLAA